MKLHTDQNVWIRCRVERPLCGSEGYGLLIMTPGWGHQKLGYEEIGTLEEAGFLRTEPWLSDEKGKLDKKVDRLEERIEEISELLDHHWHLTLMRSPSNIPDPNKNEINIT